MKVDFYKLIEKSKDKTEDLKENLVQLFDDLLQKGEILDAETSKMLAQIRAKIQIELPEFTDSK